MSFAETIRYVLANYSTFSGRAPRAEFWKWMLFFLFVAGVAAQIDVRVIAPIRGFEQFSEEAGKPLATTIMLFLALPTVAVMSRRLQDVGRSGWWVLIAVIPFADLVLLYWWLQPSLDKTESANDEGTTDDSKRPELGSDLEYSFPQEITVKALRRIDSFSGRPPSTTFILQTSDEVPLEDLAEHIVRRIGVQAEKPVKQFGEGVRLRHGLAISGPKPKSGITLKDVFIRQLGETKFELGIKYQKNVSIIVRVLFGLAAMATAFMVWFMWALGGIKSDEGIEGFWTMVLIQIGIVFYMLMGFKQKKSAQDYHHASSIIQARL